MITTVDDITRTIPTTAETPARADVDAPDDALVPEAATLAAARRLLAAEPMLGRLFLAGAASQLRRYATEAATSPFREHPSNQTRAKLAGKWADAFEAEQRARGYGVGDAELATAEAAVEPEPVAIEPNAGHGAFLAAVYEHRGEEHARAPHFEAQAAYRDDRRWKGAYVEVVISVGEAFLRFGRRVDDPGAAEAAAALVGRWARVGRALLALP